MTQAIGDGGFVEQMDLVEQALGEGEGVAVVQADTAAEESARVGSSCTSTGWPACRLACMAAPRCMLMPWVVMAGLMLLTAKATPANRPPPESGTSTWVTSGSCSRISRPRVPWPAITSGWSNGGTSVAPCSGHGAGRRAGRRPGNGRRCILRRLGHGWPGPCWRAPDRTGRRSPARPVATRRKPMPDRGCQWRRSPPQCPLFIAEAGNGVAGAAQLEATGELLGLELEVDRHADLAGQGRGVLQWRAAHEPWMR